MKNIPLIILIFTVTHASPQTGLQIINGVLCHLSGAGDTIKLQPVIVSGTTLKTINGSPLLGSGNMSLSTGTVWGSVSGTLSNQTDLQNSLNAKQANGSYAITTNNLSDLSNAVTARSNLGLVIGTNVLAPNGSAASLTNFPTLNQNTTGTAGGLSANIAESQVTNLVNDLAAKQNTITVLPFANGGISGAATTSATTGTITVSMTTSVITCTPSGNMTLNATGGVAGQVVTFSFTTSGVTSFTITFGTNFRKTGTLATGTTTARFFTVTFRCLDGTVWSEISRTAAQT